MNTRIPRQIAKLSKMPCDTKYFAIGAVLSSQVWHDRSTTHSTLLLEGCASCWFGSAGVSSEKFYLEVFANAKVFKSVLTEGMVDGERFWCRKTNGTYSHRHRTTLRLSAKNGRRSTQRRQRWNASTYPNQKYIRTHVYIYKYYEHTYII